MKVLFVVLVLFCVLSFPFSVMSIIEALLQLSGKSISVWTCSVICERRNVLILRFSLSFVFLSCLCVFCL